MFTRRLVLTGLGATCVAALAPSALWAAPIKPDEASALLVIDVQNCFLPGGSLAVKDGEQVVPVINRIAKGFANVVMTQDWHTAGHVSFAIQPFRQEAVRDRSISPTASRCCGRITACRAPRARRCPRTSRSRTPGSSSARASTRTSTAIRPSPRPTARPRPGSPPTSRRARSKRVFVAGLATDFCVAWSALDARKAGFETYVIEDACRGIDTQGSLAKAWADMTKAGVKRIKSGDIAA